MNLRFLPLLLMGLAVPMAGATPAPPGVGVVRPAVQAGTRLYFYSQPDFDQMPDSVAPVDSLVFVQGPYHVDVGYAPPWLVPEVLKLDYDLLLLRAETLTRHWIEVVVNDTGRARWAPRTLWVDRKAVTFTDWPTFLLQVVAVEGLPGETPPIRLQPRDDAGILADTAIPLRPLAVRGEWLLVSTLGLADRIPPTGWLRWCHGDRLLVRYALLL
jgi:hypothetical protein